MNRYSKAIAAAVAAVASLLVVFNVHVDEEVKGAIVTLATALAVFVAPPNQ